MKLTKEHVESCQDHPLLTVRELCDDWLAMRAMLEELFGLLEDLQCCNGDGEHAPGCGFAGIDCKLKELIG